jgi:hypothetical protein
MSDNLRPYRAIFEALRQAEPGAPQGRCARHLATLNLTTMAKKRVKMPFP